MIDDCSDLRCEIDDDDDVAKRRRCDFSCDVSFFSPASLILEISLRRIPPNPPWLPLQVPFHGARGVGGDPL